MRKLEQNFTSSSILLQNKFMKVLTHSVEETITGTVDRGQLIEFLKKNKLIPASWEFCSIYVDQPSAADDIEFISKRTTAGPGK